MPRAWHSLSGILLQNWYLIASIVLQLYSQHESFSYKRLIVYFDLTHAISDNIQHGKVY